MQLVRTSEPYWVRYAKGKLKAAQLRNKRLKWGVRKSRASKFRHKQAHQRAAELRQRPTNAELKFRSLLDSNKIRYSFQHVIFFNETAYRIADFYLPDYRTVVEIDGEYHASEETKAYDQEKDAKTRFTVLRLKNEDVFKPEPFAHFLQSLKKLEKPPLPIQLINIPHIKPNKPYLRPSEPRYQGFQMQKGFTVDQLKGMGAI